MCVCYQVHLAGNVEFHPTKFSSYSCHRAAIYMARTKFLVLLESTTC